MEHGMSNDDGREIVANIFEKTAKAAASLGAGLPDPAGAALAIGAGIASAIAGVIRSLGIDGAKEAIDELVARRDEGVITDAHVARDDDSIVAAVSSLYDDDDDDEGDDAEE
jgi:hypothetical protein